MESKLLIQLPSLNFPEKYHFRLKNREEKVQIFCPLRKAWLILTPEEWVRQHVIQFLHHEKKYDFHQMKAEHSVSVGTAKQRADIVVYKKSQAHILIECKKPDVQITQTLFDQIARYNQIINADYLMLTNGIDHLYCHMNFEEKRFELLDEIPTNI